MRRYWQIWLSLVLTLLLILWLAPWVYGAFDPDAPSDSRPLDLRDDDIRANWSSFGGAIDNEHEFNGSAAGTQEGFHRAGSAVAQVAATLVKTRPDGTAFDGNDTGRMGIDTDTDWLYYYDHNTTSWTAVSQNTIDTYTQAYVINVSSATIKAGRFVYRSGYNGTYLKIDEAQNTTRATAAVIGITAADIANTANGNIVTSGTYSFTVDNPSDYSDGDYLWAGTDGNAVTAVPYGKWVTPVGHVVSVTGSVVKMYIDIGTPLPPGERLLGSASCGLQDGDGKTTIYTVPSGYSAIVTQVVVRSPSASLADANDIDFGDGANADTWSTAVDLSSMTSTAHYMVLRKDSTAIAIFNATDAFGVLPADGTTADITATIDVFGYEF